MLVFLAFTYFKTDGLSAVISLVGMSNRGFFSHRLCLGRLGIVYYVKVDRLLDVLLLTLRLFSLFVIDSSFFGSIVIVLIAGDSELDPVGDVSHRVHYLSDDGNGL